MLKTLKVLHIGDIHFPDARDESLSDIADPGFPTAVAGLTRLKPLMLVARKLTAVLDEKPHALLFTGDLTSRGDTVGYELCLKYLNDILNLKRWSPNQLHVVPGNHDVDRTKVDPSGKDLSTKFSAFAKAWDDLGLPILAFDKTRKTSIDVPRSKNSGVTLLSLNSSLGCGERRYPQEIQDGLSTLLDAYAVTADPKAVFALLGETLDTPAFDQDHIEEMCQTISQLNDNSVPFVITHHNILPQALPRIALYGELLNSGVVRSRLSHLQRPVVYCHGHIHDHPVEIISEPEYRGSQFICIAAPKFSSGFNLISVEFGTKGVPLGCTVRSYRLNPRDGEVRPVEFRIPFVTPSYADLRRQGNALLPQILAKLPEEETRYPDLLSRLSMSVPQSKGIADALLEGEWFGVLGITDKNEQLEHWIVRKVIR